MTRTPCARLSPKGERPLEPHFSARVFSQGRGTNVGIYHDVESSGIYHDAVRAVRRRTAARQQLGKKQRQLQTIGGWVRSSGETMNDEIIGPAEETRMFRLDADATQIETGSANVRPLAHEPTAKVTAPVGETDKGARLSERQRVRPSERRRRPKWPVRVRSSSLRPRSLRR
jgi:hypothetical protein